MTTTKITESSDIGSFQVNWTLSLLEKIYPIPRASNLINKEKANDNEPPDIQVKATHQLIVKPIYLGLSQLKLKSIFFFKISHMK